MKTRIRANEEILQKLERIRDVSKNTLEKVTGLLNKYTMYQIEVSKDEMMFALKHSFIRYQKKWWEDINLDTFEWNNCKGPTEKSYDLFNDGSVELINIPGHSDGLFAVKITNKKGEYVLLYSDGGYARKSWEEGIVSGIASNRQAQKQSLEWIRQMSLDPLCICTLANHEETRQKEIIL